MYLYSKVHTARAVKCSYLYVYKHIHGYGGRLVCIFSTRKTRNYSDLYTPMHVYFITLCLCVFRSSSLCTHVNIVGTHVYMYRSTCTRGRAHYRKCVFNYFIPSFHTQFTYTCIHLYITILIALL